jgi:hypothetical protein
MLRWAVTGAIQRQPAGTRPRQVKDAITARRGKEAGNIARIAAARELPCDVFYSMRDGRTRREPAPCSPATNAGARRRDECSQRAARLQAGRGARQLHAVFCPPGHFLPRGTDYRLAGTRLKDACGAGSAGRAAPRSLTLPPARTKSGTCVERVRGVRLLCLQTVAADTKPQVNPT